MGGSNENGPGEERARDVLGVLGRGSIHLISVVTLTECKGEWRRMGSRDESDTNPRRRERSLFRGLQKMQAIKGTTGIIIISPDRGGPTGGLLEDAGEDLLLDPFAIFVVHQAVRHGRSEFAIFQIPPRPEVAG
ncbi:hypothetical protein AXG93_392s1330 [Marchantia polymorpha subsp. ruderalis]|uniref:Uncharacterized protein n=1 Tax=Marchantia polymorpha subsp. ruderalis TaxID=1480154 RepID=A0A176WR27_MARPO|nr:hypothetical protein AXG93_392s1330 [Marchantia polymorpha subsp. ruderalis]